MGKAEPQAGSSGAQLDGIELVDSVLDAYFDESIARASSAGATYQSLWRTLQSNTTGGKRFRPRAVMTAYQALGGEDLQAAAYVGAAFEMLHTALIVHDDVVDRDFVRRGLPNVSGRYRDIAHTAGLSIPTAEHRGMSVAVIAGDLALSASFRLMDKASEKPVIREHLLNILDESVYLSAAGELIDVDFSLHTDIPSVDEILQMERLKTAVYTFEGPLQAGAVLAEAPAETVAALAEFGRDIGIAYQIVDDILGVFGSEKQTGKTTLGDLREGKRTAMIAFAAQSDQWDQLKQLIGKSDLTATEAVKVRSLLTEVGARQFAEQLADDYAARAMAVLESADVPNQLSQSLAQLVVTVVERDK